MTDLTQALAELRQMELTYGQLWTAREVMQTQNADNCKSIATVLNAALSGTMIPRADADLAMALMVEKAARLIISFPGGTVMHSPPQLLTEAHDAVMGLVSASALAELQALRDDVTGWISNAQVAREKWSEYEARAEAAEAELVTLRAQVERLTGALKSMPSRVSSVTLDDGPKSLSKDNLGAWVDGITTCEKVVQRAVDAAITEGAAP